MKILAILVITMFLITFVSAEVQVPEKYNFFNDLIYKLKNNVGLFTAEGQSRMCDTNAKLTITQTESNIFYSKYQLTTGAGCSSGISLIDVFDSSWHFLAEYRSEIIGSGLNKGSPGIIEVYCCPYEACESSSDCSSPPASNYGNTCNTVYGSCYNTLPTHSTKIYKCVSSSWSYQGTASYGQTHFCLDSNQNNYIDESGAEHCANSPSSVWCSTTCKIEGQSCVSASDCCSGLDCQYFQCVATGTCSTGAEKCGIVGDPNTAGDVLYNCVSGTWQSQGRVDGKCGYNSIECSTGETKCEGYWYFTCLSGAWLNQGYVEGKCGYGSDCNTPADVDCNGLVSRAELGSYINLWLQGSVTREALGDVIVAWAT